MTKTHKLNFYREIWKALDDFQGVMWKSGSRMQKKRTVKGLFKTSTKIHKDRGFPLTTLLKLMVEAADTAETIKAAITNKQDYIKGVIKQRILSKDVPEEVAEEAAAEFMAHTLTHLPPPSVFRDAETEDEIVEALLQSVNIEAKKLERDNPAKKPFNYN